MLKHYSKSGANSLNSSINNLADLLLFKGYHLNSSNDNTICQPSKKSDKNNKTVFCKEDLKDAFYSGLNILNTSPRFAADIWGEINSYSELIKKRTSLHINNYGYVENLIANLCRNQLLRDGALTPESRRITRGGFYNQEVDELDLEALPIIKRAVIDVGCSVPFDSTVRNSFLSGNESGSFLVHKGIEWRFYLNKGNKKEHNPSQIEFIPAGRDYLSVDHLATDTTGALILFHDLLSLGNNRVVQYKMSLNQPLISSIK